MGYKIIITEEDRVDIKDKQNLDVDPNLFNYLRRNVKFKSNLIPSFKKPFITYVFNDEMRLVTSKKDTLNRIFHNLEDKWVTDEPKARRTIRKFINDSLDALK
jgi:hypothetical protein